MPNSRPKWKPKPKLALDKSHLLNLPEDLLHHLLTSLPPSALRALSQTCSNIRIYLSHDSIWRDNYTRFYTAPICLTQPCLDGRSWRSEGLAREAMIERIITSKSLPTTHYPSVGLIHTVSLYYPIPAIPAVSYRPTARQRYDARIAATVRPTPHILTAGVGAIVKSDPTSGKISKGFWGPSPNANFLTHPQSHNPSTTVYLSPDHSFALFGQNGHLVHTALETKSTNRAHSINTISIDRHQGEILDISSDGTNFITAGTDGFKHWDSTLTCLYTSPRPAVLARCVGSTLCAVSNGQLYIHNPDLCIEISSGPYTSLHLDESVFITRHLASTIEEIGLDGNRQIYTTPNAFPLSAVFFAPRSNLNKSRIIVAGDVHGFVWIWSSGQVFGFPAMDRKITAITFNSGLIAVAGSDTTIKLFDPYSFNLLRTIRLSHLSPSELAMVESDHPDARLLTVNQVIIDNDVLVAAVGRQIYGWRATKRTKDKTTKPKASRKTHKEILELDDDDSTSRSERQQLAKMDKLGFDSDDAVQYAMMLSLEQPEKDEEFRDMMEAIRLSEHVQ